MFKAELTGKTPAHLQEKFAALLKIRTREPAKLAATLAARLAALELGEKCSRCDGSGHYSYNPMDGTKCFRCQGRRYLNPSLTHSLYVKAAAAVTGGRLDAYLLNLQRRAALKKTDLYMQSHGIYMAHRFPYNPCLAEEYRHGMLPSAAPHVAAARVDAKMNALAAHIQSEYIRLTVRGGDDAEITALWVAFEALQGQLEALKAEGEAIALPAPETVRTEAHALFAKGHISEIARDRIIRHTHD